MRKLLWLLVVLVVLAVGADRAADYLAGRTVATRVQDSQHLRRTPDVDIAGFPFLTQLARQHFDRVTATASAVQVGTGDRAVTLSRLAFTFSDVRADRSFHWFEAANGQTRATIPYRELSRVLGAEISYAGRGTVRARTTFTVAGQRLRPSVTVEPRMLDGALTFTSSALENGVPAPIAEELRRIFDLEVPLSGLPFGIRATSLAADAQGVQLRLVGKHLSYTR